MIKRIIEFSAHNRFLVLVTTFVLIAFGIYSAKNIPLDAIPDLSDTQVIIYSKIAHLKSLKSRSHIPSSPRC